MLRQASAAVGQGVLIHMYERMFFESTVERFAQNIIDEGG